VQYSLSVIMQRIFKYGNIHNITLTPNKELNILIYWPSSYIIIYRSYTLFKKCAAFVGPPCTHALGQCTLSTLGSLKALNGLPISDNWTLSLSVTTEALRADIDWMSLFLNGMSQFDTKFHVQGDVPRQHSSCWNTRCIYLSYGIRRWAELSFVLSQSTHLTERDRKTDGFTKAKAALHTMQRGINCCIPVLIISLWIRTTVYCRKMLWILRGIPLNSTAHHSTSLLILL